MSASPGRPAVPADPAKPKTTPKPKRKPPTPEELSNMIQSKIHELETERTTLEEEEEAIDNSIQNASNEITALVAAQHNQGDKINVIQQKYMDLFEEHKVLERDFAKMKRKYELANKERDGAKSDLTKANAQKQKVESLCRELQKENKKIKEESQRLALSEQQKREQLSSQFESTIWEIKAKMEEDSEEKRQGVEDGEVSRTKDRLRTFLQQYEVREKHFNSLMRSKELEYQMLEARFEQQRQLMEQETLKVSTLQGQLKAFAKSESELRNQLASYVDKFKSVEQTLSKSNELFHSFRSEIEASAKKTKSLEQLCRALQSERGELQGRLQKYEAVEAVEAPEPIDVD